MTRASAKWCYSAEVGILSEQGFNDTWTWNGKNWTERNPATRPQPDGFAGMERGTTNKK
jgi:hypothetical protein